MRIHIFEAGSEAELLKVEPNADTDTLLGQIEERLGFRPAAMFLNGTRVTNASDLEEGDKVRCDRELPASSTKRPREESAATGDSSANAAAGSAAAGGGTLQLTIKEQSGDTTTFRLKPTTKLSKMMEAFASKKGWSLQSIRFLLGPDRLGPDKTPADCAPGRSRTRKDSAPAYAADCENPGAHAPAHPAGRRDGGW